MERARAQTGNNVFKIIPIAHQKKQTSSGLAMKQVYQVIKWYYNPEIHLKTWKLSDLLVDLEQQILEQDVTRQAIFYSTPYRNTFLSFEIDGKFYNREDCATTPLEGLIENCQIFKVHANYGLNGGAGGACCTIF
ncbi:UNKNOWN [Stylonychia lemnae]|uniref:Uncharacterized protein n=1 Tax=Stylonychia lemnae TaxID=5949 RepID=A0A078ACV1_STYLE|nr:UNKNOWN [Stylonychia lemnae]|eukprot:CDW78673.1 UNKNOWN [Stylonychia lemnae]